MRSEDSSSGQLDSLLTYWRGLKGDHRAPLRRDIQPKAIKHMLPRICVLEMRGPSLGPKFTLAGTALCAIWGTELRNQPMAALFSAEWRSLFCAAVQAAVAAPCPVVAEVRLRSGDMEIARGKLAFLPLIDDNGTVGKLLGYLDLTLPGRHTVWRNPELDLGEIRLMPDGIKDQVSTRQAIGTTVAPTSESEVPALPAPNRSHLRLVVSQEEPVHEESQG